MAGQTINMAHLKQIIRLRSNGVALQTIAKSVNISRNTIKKYLRLIEVKQLRIDDLLQLDDMALEALLQDPDLRDEARLQTLLGLFPNFENELKRTGVTRWVLWGEYKLRHPGGFSYSQFCNHFKKFKAGKAGTLHMEHVPADKMFIDFTGKKLPIVDPQTGEINEAEVFVATLGYSQLTYVQAVFSQKKEDLIGAVENALHYFGGVPRVLVPDNLKAAVHKANKYEAEINATFLDFANHYGTAVLPARSYKPRDKSLVEKSVSIVYSRIFAPLRNEVFYSLLSLNTAIKSLLEVYGHQAFQQRPESRRQIFESEEKHLLGLLPPDRYEISSSAQVMVMQNGHVQIRTDRHYYSVPFRFIGRKVKITYSASHVHVFYNNERIAYHRRNTIRYKYTTVKDHLSSTHRFVSDWNPDKFISWAGAIAPVVKDYILQILDKTDYPEQAYRSCVGILSFEKQYSRERLIKAAERATHFGAFNYSIIKRILETGLDQIAAADDISIQMTLPLHENIRGPQDYK